MLHKYSIKAGIIRILDFRLNFFVSSVEKTQEIFPAGCFTELKYPPSAGSLLARLFFLLLLFTKSKRISSRVCVSAALSFFQLLFLP